jgi:hypothetical protein
MVIKKGEFINFVVKVISRNYGDIVANNYKVFYADKNEKVIIESCKALLTDLVGPKSASKQVAEIIKMHKKGVVA